MTRLHLLLLLTFLTSTSAKIVLLLDENLEKCVEPEDDDKLFDMDDLDVVIETDTDIFVNGSFKFLKRIESPLKLRVFSEQYVRSKWVISMIDRRIPDACAVMHSPLEVWYKFYKEYPGCPFEAGVRNLF
jgi:hypothetical protein